MTKKISSVVANLKEAMDVDEEKKATIMSALADLCVQLQAKSATAAQLKTKLNSALEKANSSYGKSYRQ